MAHMEDVPMMCRSSVLPTAHEAPADVQGRAGDGGGDPLDITTMLAKPPWLDPIPANLRTQALRALEARDPIGFLGKANNMCSLYLVYFNCSLLQALGMYEVTLLQAFTAARVNNYHMPLAWQQWLFQRADWQRLRAIETLR